MKKVKVSKEVATALEKAIKVSGKEALLNDHANILSWTLDCYLPLNELSIWKMAQILINGYEVEETPEEKVKSLYENCINSRDKFKFGCKYYISWNAEARGIENCLNRLGITIKGIND